MVSQTVEVVNSQGIHMRPAGVLVEEMKKFPNCTVMLKTAEKSAKATAVMQIMAAGIKCGTKVEITADGSNEQAALDKAVELFKNGFGE